MLKSDRQSLLNRSEAEREIKINSDFLNELNKANAEGRKEGKAL